MWYNDLSEVVTFARALNNADEFDDVDDVLNFFERPRRWKAEHEAWEELDSPEDDNEDGWDEFVKFLGERE